MRRLFFCLTLLLAAASAAWAPTVLGPAAWLPSARAQDDAPESTVEERLAELRKLPSEDRARLREALKRFHELSPEQRDKLRAKAKAIGSERLCELKGRNVKHLRERHRHLQQEAGRVLERAIGPHRRALLADDEFAFLRDRALREFQRFAKQRFVTESGLSPQELRDPGQRKALMLRAIQRLEQAEFAKLPAERQAEISALEPDEQRGARRQLLLELRDSVATEFAKGFDAREITPFLALPAEERAARVRHHRQRVPWHHIARIAEQELELPADELRLLRKLDAAERAELVEFVRTKRSEGLTDDRLRIEVKQRIEAILGRDPQRRRDGEGREGAGRGPEETERRRHDRSWRERSGDRPQRGRGGDDDARRERRGRDRLPDDAGDNGDE